MKSAHDHTKEQGPPEFWTPSAAKRETKEMRKLAFSMRRPGSTVFVTVRKP